ncbi:MAG: sigma-70 family RNA polymerase sigma factor [Verrucomicrobiota bacterium]
MNDDQEQLRRYATSGSEDAFAALVQRFLPLVYAAALRRMRGDTHRAEDVAQLVFTALARNARALAHHPDLTGWLFTTTRFLAAKALRGERRRLSREHAASLDEPTMSEDRPRESAAFPHAVLDDVMMELRQLDRQVLLLRFHRGLRLAEIGAQLGATENAIQKRLDRALDQLKEKLARRGITSTATAVALAFEHQTVVALPAGLAAAATSAGLTGGAGVGGLLAFTSLMTISKLQLGIAAAVVVAGSGGLVWEARANAQLRADLAHQTAVARTATDELQARLTSLSQRAAAAEADAASLQKALQSAKAATPPANAPTRTLVDAREEARASRERAEQLRRDGKFQESLDEYLKCYREIAGTRVGITDQPLIMSSLKTLGDEYPAALAALRDLRDTAMLKRQADPSSRELIIEIALINERLGEGRASLALYDSLPPGDPGRQSIGNIAHASFVEARRYADALAGKSFANMVGELERHTRLAERSSGKSSENGREFVVQRTAGHIEVLAGVGKNAEALLLADKLLDFDRSETTQAAIQRHLTRATQAGKP